MNHWGLHTLLAATLAAGTVHAQPRKNATPSFSDTFTTFSQAPVEGRKWMTSLADHARSIPSNAEQEFYTDASVGRDPFKVAPDGLHITAMKEANPLGLAYTSGVITTFGSFSQLYGYFEARMKLPAGKGLWPAFWLLPKDNTWPPELDVMEMLGDRPSRLYATAHTKIGGPNVGTSHVIDIADGTAFHTYGVDWTPETLTWYYDGQRVASEPTPKDMHKPMYLLINLAVGGKWPGYPDASTVLPADMVVAWVKAYPQARP